MFDFSKEIIINASSPYVPTYAANTLTIPGFGTFTDSVSTGAITETPVAGVASNAVIRFEGATLTAGDIIRILVPIKSYKESAEYARDHITKGTTASYEVKVAAGETPVTLVDKFVSVINRYQTLYDRAKLTAEAVDGSVGGTADALQITTEDAFREIQNEVGYQIEIVTVETPSGDTTEFTDAEVFSVTANTLPFGDFEFLRSNVRILTDVNTEPDYHDSNELPRRGETYNYYAWNNNSARPELGGTAAVGQVVSSSTRMIVWVSTANTAAVAALDAFQAANA